MTLQNTKRFDDVRPGETLPELAIPITVGLVTGGAIATRDYFPGHHDLNCFTRWRRERAVCLYRHTGRSHSQPSNLHRQ